LSRKRIDRLDVDSYIQTRLDQLQPAPHHLIIPRFAWPAIFTTNYDRLIEKAYDQATDKVQRYQAIRSPNEPADVWRPDLVNVFKLHGCISRLQDPEAPLILSGEDFRRTAESRGLLLKRLADLQRANTWVFVGYSFEDDVITDLLTEMSEKIGDHLIRWSYALIPGADEYIRDYLHKFKVLAIDISAEDFFETLSSGHTNKFVQSKTPIPADNRFADIVREDWFRELEEQFEILGLRPFGSANPSLFYRGNRPSWADLSAQLDVNRDVVPAISTDLTELVHVASTDENQPTSAILIKGSAGTGKSTLVRRLAFNAYQDNAAHVLVARAAAQWDPRGVIAYQRRVRAPILIVIDSGELDFQGLRSFYRYLVDRRVPCVLLIAARTNEWFAAQRKYGQLSVQREHNVPETLSVEEVKQLIEIMQRVEAIQLTATADNAYWLRRAREAGFIMLVFLLEVSENGRFDEIILSEYQGIGDPIGQKAYQAVSGVHEFGVPLKRELLRRYLNCNWSEFVEQVLRGAAMHVVIEDYETLSGRAFYRTKHSQIAQVVREHTVQSLRDLLRDLFLIVQPGDPDEQFVVREILKKSEHLRESIPDLADRRVVFQAAMKVLPRDIVIRHQMGIDEMAEGNLEDARRIFESCLDLQPRNSAVVHTLGMLEWECARRQPVGPLQNLYYERATTHFDKVTEMDSHSEYGYHSKAAMILWRARRERDKALCSELLSDALLVVQDGIRETELDEGSRLFDLKGELLSEIGLSAEAKAEYEARVDQEKATARTYWLLATLELESRNEGRAREMVRRGLERFPEANLLLAMRAVLALHDNLGRAELVDILGPAVRFNPSSLVLRFDLACNLYMLGNMDEARRHFERTRRLSQGMFARGRVRKWFTNVQGDRISFEGRLERTGQRGGFLRAVRADNGDSIYFNIEHALASGVRQGSQVRFKIGFGYLGTIAFDLQPLR
jgi:tetratricopeptide (TPR) repeat protein